MALRSDLSGAKKIQREEVNENVGDTTPVISGAKITSAANLTIWWMTASLSAVELISGSQWVGRRY